VYVIYRVLFQGYTHVRDSVYYGGVFAIRTQKNNASVKGFMMSIADEQPCKDGEQLFEIMGEVSREKPSM
jgi:hypothetical protein